jgi:hypothetical protein
MKQAILKLVESIKEDLKDMLFLFHNSVNARKNYKPMAPVSLL